MRKANEPRNLFVFHASGEAVKRAYAEHGYLPLGRILTDAGLQAMRTECMAAPATAPADTPIRTRRKTNRNRNGSRQFSRPWFGSPIVWQEWPTPSIDCR